MKNEDVNNSREKINNDIDKIIEDDKCEKEGTLFKPSHLFLTISIVCLTFVFGYIKGLCIFGFVIGCILFFTNESKSSNKPKKKEYTDRLLTEDEFEEVFK